MNDVFISYEHESKSIADNICSVLERNRIRCWYAPRDVIGDYATSIVEAISNSKVFVLILNENSSNSRHVLNEVEMAYKIENELTIIPFRVDDKNLSLAMEYYIKRLHWIDASNRSLDVAIDDLMMKIKSILKIENKPANKVIQRAENKYFTNSDIKERRRLATQAKLLKRFDQEIYDSVLPEKSNLSVLDVGSNTGDLVMDRLGHRPGLSHLIGLEYDQSAVDSSNAKFGNDVVSFHQCDIEGPQFETTLISIMEEKGVDNFDIVNMSMIILHLKNPYKVIRTLRKHMSADGMIVVRDIDDGTNLAYPDPNGDFERVYRICSQNETSGYRYSGRQVYSLLKKSGFSDIKMVRNGLNSIGMSFDDKQALFDSYFSFVMDDIKIMAERYPSDDRVQKDYLWYIENYDRLEEEFHVEEFMFSLGFMMFTAKNK